MTAPNSPNREPWILAQSELRECLLKNVQHLRRGGDQNSVQLLTDPGFWSLVKRGIGGVYHSVSAKFLQSYLNEYSFRYNRRDSGNLIFCALLERVSEMASRKPALEALKNPTL